eukprot:TRINITY_DN10535_c0_g2_i1.p1 TRINITY_DN10535_c0_g2~~TRINITY_DN10535_c0_g2_i1.p1  ORF type:complete len:266 (+),score=54.72 TRINITY_DN10535_c0_g2_i1:226-1023(+)
MPPATLLLLLLAPCAMTAPISFSADLPGLMCRLCQGVTAPQRCATWGFCGSSDPRQHCVTNPGVAPIAIDITNAYAGDIKVRGCNKYNPVSGAPCVGNPLKPNHYNDCPQLIGSQESNTVLLDADTQYIAFVSGSSEIVEFWKPSSGQWPPSYTVRKPGSAAGLVASAVECRVDTTSPSTLITVANKAGFAAKVSGLSSDSAGKFHRKDCVESLSDGDQVQIRVDSRLTDNPFVLFSFKAPGSGSVELYPDPKRGFPTSYQLRAA